MAGAVLDEAGANRRMGNGEGTGIIEILLGVVVEEDGTGDKMERFGVVAVADMEDLSLGTGRALPFGVVNCAVEGEKGALDGEAAIGRRATDGVPWRATAGDKPTKDIRFLRLFSILNCLRS